MKATIRSKTTNVVKFPDPEICRRCGASMQLTHHELCESRDGTPTDLDDSTVRRLIRQEHPELRKKFFIDDQLKPDQRGDDK